MTAAGQEIQSGSILLRDGRIVAVGTNVQAPTDATVVDGTGKWVTPGVIDTHSHIGVYAAPGTFAESDGNEATRPVTAEVWAEHSFWPQDPQIPLAIAGGVTTIQALPGSANLIGGRSAVLKLVPARSVQEMKFPGARYGLKMACGENPKRTYGERGGPSTRMGNMAGYRDAFIQAQAYRRKWDKWNKDHQGDPPERNLRNESLAEVLRGNIYVQNHCYRADEMMQMLDLAASRSAPSTTQWRRTRSPTCWRARARRCRSGRTGGASRKKRWTGSTRTPHWCSRPGAGS